MCLNGRVNACECRHRRAAGREIVDVHVGAMALAFAYTLYECWLCLHLDSLSLSHIYVLLNCAMTSPCFVSFNSIASPRLANKEEKEKCYSSADCSWPLSVSTKGWALRNELLVVATIISALILFRRRTASHTSSIYTTM